MIQPLRRCFMLASPVQTCHEQPTDRQQHLAANIRPAGPCLRHGSSPVGFSLAPILVPLNE